MDIGSKSVNCTIGMRERGILKRIFQRSKAFIILCVLLSASLLASEGEEPLQPRLVCVHGFLRQSGSMSKIVKAFQKEGWDVVNWGYPSKAKTIAEHGADLAGELKKISLEKPGQPISFVTHSLGGLILRAALNHQKCPDEAKRGKAVLLGPPNRGALMGRKLGVSRLVEKFCGRCAGKELLKTPEGGFEQLGEFPKGMEVMIVAGSASYHPFLPEKSDGTVMISETELTTPHHHVVIPVLHSFLPLSARAIQIARDFLSRRF